MKTKLLTVLLIILLGLQLWAQVSLPQLKAAYIEKFTRFIDWPEGDLEGQESFIIGYYQMDEFMEIFQAFLVDINIKERPVEFLFISHKSEISKCNIIYIPKLPREKRTRILEDISERPILTISHSKKYAEYGVHINFYVERGKLKFEMNPDAIKKSHLKASFHLLSLAKIVPAQGE